MNLDDLRTEWAQLDRKLQTSIQLNAQLLRQARWQQAGSALRRLMAGIGIELLLNVAAVMLLGVFIGNHLDEPRFLVPAIVLDVGAIALIVAGSRQLAALCQVDYSVPIVIVQRKLAALKVERIRTVRWTLLLAPLLWVPLLIVTLEGVFGVDAYEKLSGAWLIVNLLAGAALTPLLFWVSRRVGERFQGAPWMQRLLDDIAGRSLRRATAFLDELARMEGDPEHA